MAARHIPHTMRKLIGTKLSPNFREATAIVEAPVPQPGPSEVLVHNRFVGINASDINFTAGRYLPSLEAPYDVGFEGLGEVVSVGADSKLKIGQPVIYAKFGAFADYKVVSSKSVIPVPSAKPEFLSLIVSGLTAALSLDKIGEIKKGENVLVTAAAGGTGQFAVQIAKEAGCHVIGTCSSDDKVKFLQTIGCDRPVNYNKESLKEVLKMEYPDGVDVVYESVGGEMFDLCVNNLAVKGRLIVIGFISGYESATGFKPSRTATLPTKLLSKSASVRGFFLNHFWNDAGPVMAKLVQQVLDGKLRVSIDKGENTNHGPFTGLDKIQDAVDYMYSKQNKGKVIVELISEQSKL
ncbi:prostaglandin reductase-3-like [Gigantopelta aegis]|uniref:prostaglandin reductase-3-like n=1 Tax=Gigantopelta aegis TaxID=1735272 RepID=UPI001B88D762|nr:prostaglandin reductase-3-like [Gigantopelta aegis]